MNGYDYTKGGYIPPSITYKVTIDSSALTDLIQLIEDKRITLEEAQGKKVFVDSLYFEKNNEQVYIVKII